MKICITAFLLLSIAGIVETAIFRYTHTGFDAKETREYYAGAKENDYDESMMKFPKSKEELLETFHLHIFIMPLYYLALCHIFFLVQIVNDSLKTIVTCIIFAGILLEISLPWLTVLNGCFARLFFISGPMLLLSTLTVNAVILYEMWFIKNKSSSST